MPNPPFSCFALFLHTLRGWVQRSPPVQEQVRLGALSTTTVAIGICWCYLLPNHVAKLWLFDVRAQTPESKSCLQVVNNQSVTSIQLI